jgi:GDP-L-fucose synthase
MIDKQSKIFIAGHTGLVGSSIHKKFVKKGFKNIVTIPRKILDLRNKKNVESFFKAHNFDAVILAAAKVGGIKSNETFKSQFIFENLEIQNNVIYNSFKNNVKNLIFLGSSCIYPKYSRKEQKKI